MSKKDNSMPNGKRSKNKESWRDKAAEIMLQLCKLGKPFSSDEYVWEIRKLKLPDEDEAIANAGNVFRSAKARKWIEKTAWFRLSLRAERDGQILTLWRPTKHKPESRVSKKAS